jgi:hypothetical protein
MDWQKGTSYAINQSIQHKIPGEEFFFNWSWFLQPFPFRFFSLYHSLNSHRIKTVNFITIVRLTDWSA